MTKIAQFYNFVIVEWKYLVSLIGEPEILNLPSFPQKRKRKRKNSTEVHFFLEKIWGNCKIFKIIKFILL